jgi:predicted RNA binding protein YcfA (HicA-like mRNA interferase family)
VPKLPRVSGDETISALEKLGFVHARQRGSHVIMKKIFEDRAIGCAVPRHRELAPGTLRGILKLANVSIEDFLSALK